ncbi:MAG: PAS domain-containing protein, partial [Rhizobacter sp.]
MRTPDAAAPPLPLAAWSSLIEAMLDAVWLVDPATLAIVAANRVAGALMATEPEALVGRTMIELAATPEDLCFWGEVADGLDDRIESDTLIARTDGAVVSVTRRVSRVVDADGEALF